MEENKKNKIPNVPNLRFSFDGEWIKHKLHEIAQFLPGLTYSPSDIRKEGKIVLRSSNIQNGLLDMHDLVFVDENIVKSDLRIKPFDILMCIRNGSKKLVGKTALITVDNSKLTWGAFMAIIRPKSKTSFIFHYLNSSSFFKQVFPDTNTATVNQITAGIYNNCKVFIPSEYEQQKISVFLDLIDSRINTQNKIIDKCKSLIKCICDSAEMNSNKQLKEIANYNSSIIKESTVSSKGKYPVFGAAGICGYLDDYVFSKAGIAIVKDGAGVGRLLKIKNDKYSILGTMGLIEAKNDISQDYLWLALKRIKFKKYIVGSGIPHIYFSDYSSAQIPAFTNKNLIKAKLCSLLLDKIKINKDVLNKYLKQKIFLLNNLFI